MSPTEETHITRILAGRYQLIRLVGHGGMGSVYEARHVHTEKTVAVKLLSPQLSKDLKLVARFRREAMAASRLEHENCVHVDDFGEDGDGTFYIAMEFIDGHGLADELRATGPMSPERVARIAVQLLKALDAAHTGGVLHRDLKPQNVMLMQRPQRPDIVKVVDFGIAKLTTNTAEDQGALTVPGTIFGTPEYMSPEQARGEPLDQRSDIYSAAVVLWHMLLGRSPFRGTSVRETLMKVFADEPPLPSQERPGVTMPPGFEQVLRRAMAKKREDRYPDAASFLEALRPYVTGTFPEVPRRPLSGLPVDGGPPPPTLDDSRSATLALPESELPPLAASAPVGAPAEAPMPPPSTSLPPPPAPDGEAHAARVVTIDAVTRHTHAGQPVTAPTTTSRRRRRASPARTVAIAVAVAGMLVLVAGGLAAGYLVASGRFDDQRAPPPRQEGAVVVDVSKKEKVTNIEVEARKEKLDADLAEVPVDPILRDEGIRRAEQAFAAGDIANARKGYEDALLADPAAPRALIGVATIAFQQKDWDVACAAFEKLMALDAKYERQFRPLYARAKKFRDGAP